MMDGMDVCRCCDEWQRALGDIEGICEGWRRVGG